MVSDSVQKLDGTIEEDAANVDGSVPKRPHLEEKANGSVHLEIRIIQKGHCGKQELLSDPSQLQLRMPYLCMQQSRDISS
ncbi:uncharacterized protein LOC125844798 isoform X3 [Solanum stenotomum]|uniref:uncharacterized protein LOC125844798 isoform X3 n=1 Tax=Solanum stenotomum TaxID=172797 RepID=UPI0020D0925A|nr:uncharacterized protein LOC125844798 isoform X3 [Solanum stenotomum]